jgi:hypothetical protein
MRVIGDNPILQHPMTGDHEQKMAIDGITVTVFLPVHLPLNTSLGRMLL